MIWVHFISNSHREKIVWKLLVNLFPVHVTSNSHRNFFVYVNKCKIFAKFQTWKSVFFPLFLSQIRKLEKSAHLFILNYRCAKFQENQGTFFFFIHHHHSKYSTCKTSAGVGFTTLQNKSQVNFIKEFPYKLIWTPRKKDKRIPFKFIKTQHLKD